MAYVNTDDLAQRLSLVADLNSADFAPLLQQSADWAQAFIDSHCGRTFEAVTATRAYELAALDPDEPRRLVLDADLLAVTTLTNGDTDQTTITSGNYVLEPRNATAKRSILLTATGTPGYWTFDQDQVVSVAGTWGATATADALITGIATRLAEWHFRSKDKIETQAFQDGGMIARAPAFPKDVLPALDRLRRLF